MIPGVNEFTQLLIYTAKEYGKRMKTNTLTRSKKVKELGARMSENLIEKIE